MKHATGATASVGLVYDDADVTVRIDNVGGATNGATGSLASSGGGYGLRGIAERLALLGGQVEAGPTADGWRVTATVPTGVTQKSPPVRDPLST
jgi:signal transduction histidine kinase